MEKVEYIRKYVWENENIKQLILKEIQKWMWSEEIKKALKNTM